MEVEVIGRNGAKTGQKVTLDDSIFGIEPHEHSMWLAIKVFLANQRQGNHSTKGRGEIAGSTRKLFRQKGTGRARQGDIKSGLHPGGGTMHGPKTHKHTLSLPKQVKQLARKSALAQKVRDNSFIVIEDFGLTSPKTKDVQGVLDALKLDKKQALLLTGRHDDNVYRSGRNIPTLTVLEASKASMYEIWRSRAVILERSAIEALTASFSGGTRELEVEHISLPA
jgi:large subunit ribosomal protein L4